MQRARRQRQKAEAILAKEKRKVQQRIKSAKSSDGIMYPSGYSTSASPLEQEPQSQDHDAQARKVMHMLEELTKRLEVIETLYDHYMKQNESPEKMRELRKMYDDISAAIELLETSIEHGRQTHKLAHDDITAWLETVNAQNAKSQASELHKRLSDQEKRGQRSQRKLPRHQQEGLHELFANQEPQQFKQVLQWPAESPAESPADSQDESQYSSRSATPESFSRSSSAPSSPAQSDSQQQWHDAPGSTPPVRRRPRSSRPQADALAREALIEVNQDDPDHRFDSLHRGYAFMRKLMRNAIQKYPVISATALTALAFSAYGYATQSENLPPFSDLFNANVLKHVLQSFGVSMYPAFPNITRPVSLLPAGTINETPYRT
jgi:hypothetical protein